MSRRNKNRWPIFVEVAIAQLIGEEPYGGNYFDKEIRINPTMYNGGFMSKIDVTKPFFYNLVENLYESFMQNNLITLEVHGTVKKIANQTLTQAEKKQHVINHFFYYSRNETNLHCVWSSYNSLVKEERANFWKLLFEGISDELEEQQYDFYDMFAPETYAFCKSKEPEIDHYILEVVKAKGWQQEKIEKILGKHHTFEKDNNEVATGNTTNEASQQTLENKLIKKFVLTKYPKPICSFSLMDNESFYKFMPHPEKRPWILKIIRCWREKETLSFAYDEASGEVVEVW